MADRRILIVDDASLVRDGVKSILTFHSREWIVCGECSNGKEALLNHNTLKPDVILMDLSLPDENGLAVAKKIRGTNPKARIVIMSEQDPHTLELMTRGMQLHSVPKSRLTKELIPALQRALAE